MAVFMRQVNCYSCDFTSDVIRVKLSCASWEAALWAVFINKDEFELFTGVTIRRWVVTSFSFLHGVPFWIFCPNMSSWNTAYTLSLHYFARCYAGLYSSCLECWSWFATCIQWAYNYKGVEYLYHSIYSPAHPRRVLLSFTKSTQYEGLQISLIAHWGRDTVFPIFSLIEISVDSNQWMSTYSEVFIKSVFHWSVLQPPIWRGLNSVRRNNFLISICQLQNLSVKNSWGDDYSHCQKVDH